MDNVKKTWDDVRDLITNKKLKIERKTKKDGTVRINKSGTFMEASNLNQKRVQHRGHLGIFDSIKLIIYIHLHILNIFKLNNLFI